jgi:hypothetical protein
VLDVTEEAEGVGSVVALFVDEALRETTTNARTMIPAKTINTTRFEEFFAVVALTFEELAARDFAATGAGVVLTVLTPGRTVPVETRGTGGTIKVVDDFLVARFAAFFTDFLAALFFTARLAVTFLAVTFLAVFLTAFLAVFFAVFLTATFRSSISID